MTAKTTLPDEMATEIVCDMKDEIVDNKKTPLDTKNSLPTTYDCLQYSLYRNKECDALSAFKELQTLYENGSITYPRTESRKYYVMEGQHGGIRALKVDDNVGDEDDSLLTFISKRTLIAKKDGLSISKITLTEALKRKLEDTGIFDVSVYLGDKQLKEDNFALFTPSLLMGRQQIHHYSDAKYTTIKRSNSALILERLHELRLARPSTIARHTDRTLRYIKNEDGGIILNNKGLTISLQGDSISVALRSVELAREINHNLHKNNLNIEERVAKCLNVINQKSEKTNNSEPTID